MKAGAHIESYPTIQCGVITRLNDPCPRCAEEHLWSTVDGLLLCAKCSHAYKLNGEPSRKEVNTFTDVLKNIAVVRQEYAQMTAEQKVRYKKVAFGQMIREVI